MTMNVLDVSNHQQGMKISGYDGYIFKATEGIDYTDKFCDGYVNQAKALEKPYGVYHFLDGTDVKQQAQYFFKETQGYLGEAIFILDYEAYGLVHNVAKVQEFCSEFTKLSGLNVIIYASESVINERSWNQYMTENHAFWVAKYSSNKPSLNNKDIIMIGWQYSGSPLDKSYFYITPNVWKKYAYTPKGKNANNDNVVNSVVYQTKTGLYEALKDDTFYLEKELDNRSNWTIKKGQRFFFSEVVQVGKYTRAKFRMNNDIRYCTLRNDYWKLIYETKGEKIK